MRRNSASLFKAWLVIASSFTMISLPAVVAAQKPPERGASSAAGLVEQALALHASGNSDEAEEILVRAARLAEKANGLVHEETIFALLNLAHVQRSLRHFDQAEAVLQRVSSALAAVPGAPEADRLSISRSIAEISFERGRPADAASRLTPLLVGFESALGAAHPETLATGNLLGRALLRDGRASEAEAMFRRVLSGREQRLGARHPDTLNTLVNLAAAQMQLDRAAEAEPALLRVIEAAEAQPADNRQNLMTALNNLGALYYGQGRLADAEGPYRRSLSASEQLFGEEHPQTLRTMNNLATLYAEQERVDEAEQLFTRLLTASARTLGAEHPDTLSAINNRATLHNARGQYEDSERLYRGLVEVRTRTLGASHPATLVTLENLAITLGELGRHRDAETLLSRLLTSRTTRLGSDHPATLRTATDLVAERLQLPGAERSALEPAHLLRRAAESRVPAAGNFEQLRDRRDAGTRRQWARTFADAAWRSSSEGIDPELRAQAFAALQDAMLGEATEAITRRAALSLAGRGGQQLADLVAERDRLDRDWVDLYERTYLALEAVGTEAEQDRARLAAARRGVELRRSEIDEELQAKFPRYVDLVRPRPISESAAQKLVGHNEAILMIVPARFGTHLIAVTDSAIHWRHSGWTAAQVLTAVRRLRWYAGAPVSLPPEELRALQAEAGDGSSFDRRTAHALYRQVVAPLLTAMEGKTHLYVAAAGSLSSLPFSVLVSEAPQGADDDPAALRATSWLGDRFALTHIPSIPALASLRAAGSSRPTERQAPLMGFGDPVLARTASQRGLSRSGLEPWSRAVAVTRSAASANLVDPAQLLQLARLPGTAVELEAVRAVFGAPPDALHLGRQATESAVRNADLRSARLLSFATHALVPGELDGIAESGLVLSPPAEPSSADDGFLAASEVATLQIAADWVVLSACNTATSVDGQGLSDLARAFFHAGARNLLASHWPVSDEVAPRLVVDAVQRHRDGVPRATALQRAMIAIRNDTSRDETSRSWAHPFFWAPFVLVGGDPNPLH